MTMARLLERFYTVETGEDVRALIATLASSDAESNPITRGGADCDVDTIWENTGRRCHVCSGELDREDVVVECFGSPSACLATHRGCHLVRAGLAPDYIMLAMKIGFWTMMRVHYEECPSWRHALVDDWMKECGSDIGSSVSAPNVHGWTTGSSIRSPDELVHFTRQLYLHERETPKWANQGREVPAWDESITWKTYKKEVFMPAYETLKRLKDRKTLLPDPVVLARTNGQCALCGGMIELGRGVGRLGLAKDHIHPFSKGGSDELSNLQPLHRFCNGAISSVGPGEIPLSLQIGRWIIESTLADSDRTWTEKHLKTYATKLRSDRKSSAARNKKV